MPERFPTHCWCGAPVQDSTELDHRWRQCAEHCELARYRRGLPVLDHRRPDYAS